MTGAGRLGWGLAALAGLGALLYLLAPVLTPFFAAALIAYLGDPLVDRLEARRLSRTGAVVIVFVTLFSVFTALILLLIPLLQDQLAVFIAKLPQYLKWLADSLIPRLESVLGIELARPDLAGLKKMLAGHWQDAKGMAAGIMATLGRSGGVLLGWVANLIMIPVITFYLLRDWDVLVAHVRELLPRDIEPTVSRLARESDEVLAAFLRGQLMVMLALGVIYSVGLWLIGLEFSLLIGLFAGLVSFVPYLGLILGATAAGVAVLFQTQDVFQLLPVLAVFGVAQLLEGVLLTPWFVGDRIGLHPVAVIFAVLAGGQLFGFVGVLLALPVAAVLVVLLRHAHRTYKDSAFYGPGPGSQADGKAAHPD